MVLSHRKQYIYFVIPKCGSTTVRTALKPYTDVGYPVCTFNQHVTISDFFQTEYKAYYDDYFKFSFVRNPYDRIYSGFEQDYYASKNYPRWIKSKTPIFEKIGKDFNRYIREYVASSDLEHDWEWVNFFPMHLFTHQNASLEMNFVGKTENLKKDFVDMSQMIQLDAVPVVNKNVRVKPQHGYKYLDKYERDTLQIINDIYERDFQEFDYVMIDPSEVEVLSEIAIAC